MEFNISSSALLKSITDVSKAIPGKTTNTILENFLMVVSDGTLTITATDGELTLRTSLELDNVKEDGSMAVGARQIIDLLRTLPDQPICIKTVNGTNFECIWSNGKSSIPYTQAEDYPEIKGTGENARTLTIPAAVLFEGISSTMYATADDEMRPAMNGIFFDLDPAGSTMVASDAHKLICYSAAGIVTEEKDSFILHKKPAAVLRSIIDKDIEEVKVSYDNNYIVFNFARTMMVCRPINGKYPRYREVIPQNNANILHIDRSLLLGALRRVSVCASKASNFIKFDFKDGGLEVTAQDLSMATDAYEKVSCEYDGCDLSIGFKSNFLIEMLANMVCENLVMKFGDNRRAVLLEPEAEEAETEKTCGIIMPIMVS